MPNDLYIVMVYFITGILIGILFDIFRITRKSFTTPNIITYIEDILFWLLSGMLLIYVIFTFTTGEIRLYMIIILILGVITYFVSISKYFVFINTKIIQFIKNLIAVLLKPFIVLIKKIVELCRNMSIHVLKSKKNNSTIKKI